MRLVNHTFRFRALGDWINQTTDDLFADKKVVLFSLPGAFTPTCSSQQLPGYEGAFNEFKELGVDEVYCMSVNDAFVMNAWGNAQGIEKIKMIADGDGVFTRSMGMLVDKPFQKFGLRSWRYSAVINNGVVEMRFVEPGFNQYSDDDDPYTVSSPEHMLKYLQQTDPRHDQPLPNILDKPLDINPS